MDVALLIRQIAVLALPVLFAITLHEAAHGWVASRLGDNTARMLGRVTLNPLKHIDIFGTIVVPMLMLLFAGFMFGWAKPVPVNAKNLANPKRDMGVVAIAGPASNLVMAFFWAVIVLLGGSLHPYSQWVAMPLIYMGAAGVFVNAILMALNLLPLLPLDGGRVVNALLPPRQSAMFSKIEPFGIVILIALMLAGALNYVLWPVVWATIDALPASDMVYRVIQLRFGN